MKLIELYNEWVRLDEMPKNGLCNSVPYRFRKRLSLFQPNEFEKEDLATDEVDPRYWGYEYKNNSVSQFIKARNFTPLLQTIVLLIACMHNEY